MQPALRLPRSTAVIAASLVLLLVACASLDKVRHADSAVDWSRAKVIARVDPRFQSFNVEMVEVTGGRFWAPYGGTPGEMFASRPPLDFGDERLRNLARHLAPAYMRISGTWANKTFFDDAPTAASKPPEGFDNVLTAAQWDAANRFAQELDLKVMTSFAVGAGTRDAQQHWTPDNARRLIDYSMVRKYPLAAAEFFNEPNFSAVAGLPKEYGAGDYQRDFRTFVALRNESAPALAIAGPGAVGEVRPLLPIPMGAGTAQLLPGIASELDAVSYHFYPATSVRCAPMKGAQTSQAAALSEEFLASTEGEALYYANLRDRFAPGKPLWLTETGGAACGGNPWSASFLDTFRYVEQMGRLAKHGVQIVMHNTLSASDYALIDDRTGEPRPSYWAAVLWRQLMGERVLDVPFDAGVANVSAYGHCLRDAKGFRDAHDGALTLLLINRDQHATHTIDVGKGVVEQYALTAPDLLSNRVLLGGAPLSADGRGNFSKPVPLRITGGVVSLAPASINFVVLRDPQTTACR